MRRRIVAAWTRKCDDPNCNFYHLTWFGRLHLKLLKFWIPAWLP